jgi:hypothetical protein
VIANSNWLKDTPDWKSLAPILIVTVTGPLEVSMFDGENDAERRVGGVVSAAVSMTVKVPGKPRLTRVADCRVM